MRRDRDIARTVPVEHHANRARDAKTDVVDLEPCRKRIGSRVEVSGASKEATVGVKQTPARESCQGDNWISQLEVQSLARDSQRSKPHRDRGFNPLCVCLKHTDSDSISRFVQIIIDNAGDRSKHLLSCEIAPVRQFLEAVLTLSNHDSPGAELCWQSKIIGAKMAKQRRPSCLGGPCGVSHIRNNVSLIVDIVSGEPGNFFRERHELILVGPSELRSGYDEIRCYLRCGASLWCCWHPVGLITRSENKHRGRKERETRLKRLTASKNVGHEHCHTSVRTVSVTNQS